ncbi:MAG: aminopeptidase [Verrucomicrobiaceae bacterium]|nr:aminopeptidase [Verrucomicrobiaceae bacterium]
MKALFPILSGFVLSLLAAEAHEFDYAADPFRQLGTTLPTPSETRLASGAPGPAYWQQRADYHIKITLDDDRQHLTGSEVITYHNHSPHILSYLWLQLDQNRFKPDSGELLTKEAPGLTGSSFHNLRSQLSRNSFDGGYKITKVADKKGKGLSHAIIGTMMRIDLPQALQPGKHIELNIDWTHNIIDADLNRARGGHEYFKEDKNYIYEIAQWFPRMVAYTDYTGWQNKQFLGRGEFTLEFGDYRVEITAPADHIVAATGELQNSNEVLTEQQRKRLDEGKQSGKLTFIVTPEEAKAAEDAEEKPEDSKTWIFSAKNVRDFAWASSRKFIWDAKYHEFSPGKRAWAMSFYPNEAEPLWSKYSTAAVAHTLDVFSKFTFDYPYPVAISVNGPVGGMEYPMICFNGPRPEKDGTYSEGTKHALIGVVIHEVGHNWFPMIVNSDERQWTWMDEGLNTFVEFLAEMEWQEKWPGSRGKPKGITGYMAGSHQRPIMTNSEAIHQFGNNAYAKPAAALNVLRETVMGREVFDFAFKEYSRRWMFKRPEPADFFRSMEDASGIDLDWFWRGWFYTTKHVDVAMKALRLYEIDTRDPDIEKPLQREKRDEIASKDLTDRRNSSAPKATERDRSLLDFYNKFDKLDVTEKDRSGYRKFLDGLDDEDKKLLALRRKFYVIELENTGGLVTPLVIAITYAGGTTETLRIPAEIWRRNTTSVRKMIIARKEITGIEFDPLQETADANRDNNYWPPRAIKSRFQLHKSKKGGNPMRDAENEKKRLRKEQEKKKNAEKPKDQDAKE